MPDVTKNTIEKAMRIMAQWNTHEANVYLEGGAMLVYTGIRPGATEDIDVYVEGDASTGIQKVKSFVCKIEEFNPGGVLPWPQGWKSRCQKISTIRKISFYLMDPVVAALTKFNRFQPKDQRDIQLLLASGLVSPEMLRQHFEAIRPILATGKYHINVAKFEQNFNSIIP